MNKTIKKIICLLFYLAFYLLRDTPRGLLILTYHRISEFADPTDPLKISVGTFEKQIRFLKSTYSIISGKDLSDHLTGIRKLPHKACLITFDDGWEDNYTLGFRILKKYEIPALIFVSTDYIGTAKVFWQVKLRKALNQNGLSDSFSKDTASRWPPDMVKKIIATFHSPPGQKGDRINQLIESMKTFPIIQVEGLISCLSRLPDEFLSNNEGAMLSWEEVAEMSKSGISFGSHSKSHSILTLLEENAMSEEVAHSKKMLEEKLKKPIYFIAYPNGDFNQRVIRVVKKAGFLAGFTCKAGISKNLMKPFELKRLNMREESASGLFGTFSSLFYKIELSATRYYLKDIIGW